MSASIFVGHAKPPADTVSGHMYTILSVVCEVDMETGVIIAGEFTGATDLAKDYLNRLLSGRNLATDEDAIIEGWPLLLSGGYHRLHRPLLLRRAPEPA